VFGINQAAQLLPLIDQAVALLPEAQRWRATFITYYTNLPPEIDCRIRCVLAGTEEAKSAAARGAVIDLTRPLGRAPDGPYVTLARTGPKASPRATGAFPLAPPLPPPSPANARPATDPSLPAEPDEAAWPQSLRLDPPAPGIPSPALAPTGKSMPGLPGRPPRINPPGLKNKSSRSGDAQPTTRRIGWLLSGTSGLVVLLLLLVSIPLILMAKKQSDLLVELSQPGSFGPERNFSTAAPTGPTAPPAAVMPENQSATSPPQPPPTPTDASPPAPMGGPTSGPPGEPTPTAQAASPAQAASDVAPVTPEMPKQSPELLPEAEETVPAAKSPQSQGEQQRTTDAEAGANEELIFASLDAKVFLNEGKLKLIFKFDFELTKSLQYRVFSADNAFLREERLQLGPKDSIAIDKGCSLNIAPNASSPTEHDILLSAELQASRLASAGAIDLKLFFGDANDGIKKYQNSSPKLVDDKLPSLGIKGSLSPAVIGEMRKKRGEAEKIAGKIQEIINKKMPQPTDGPFLVQSNAINQLIAHLSEANLTKAAQAIDAFNGKEIDLGSLELYKPQIGSSEIARRATPVYKRVPLKFKVSIAD